LPATTGDTGNIAAFQVFNEDQPLFRSTIVVVLLGLTAATNALAETAAQRLNVLMEDLHTLQAAFVQTVIDERKRVIEEGRGTVSLQRPGRFRWDYVEPVPQLIIANGDRVWIYDSELAQVVVRPLDKTVGNTPALLLSSDHPLWEDFKVVALGARENLDWFELRPHSRDASFTSVRLGFGATGLQVMALHDNFGQTTRLRFTGVVTNKALDPLLFDFVPPEGVDVISETGE
jgi:outer membrane lipoprotein carrier protein